MKKERKGSSNRFTTTLFLGRGEKPNRAANNIPHEIIAQGAHRRRAINRRQNLPDLVSPQRPRRLLQKEHAGAKERQDVGGRVPAGLRILRGRGCGCDTEGFKEDGGAEEERRA